MEKQQDNKYISKVIECRKLVENISSKTKFIQNNSLLETNRGMTPSTSELDSNLNMLIDSLLELNDSLSV